MNWSRAFIGRIDGVIALFDALIAEVRFETKMLSNALSAALTGIKASYSVAFLALDQQKKAAVKRTGR